MSAEEPPRLRIVRGNPTPEELAAVVTVLAALAAAPEEAPARNASCWADPARRLRQPMYPGPGAWVRSGLPG